MTEQVFSAGRPVEKKLRVSLITALAGLSFLPVAHAQPISHSITHQGVDWVSGGASGIGSAGTGNIDINGVTGSVTRAYLYWHGIDRVGFSGDGVYDNEVVTFNGTEVTGVHLGSSSTNCWKDGSSSAYRADVTTYVTGNGSYVLQGLASDIGHDANGASLIVIFDDGDNSNNRDLVIFDGNDSSIPFDYPGEDEGWHALLSPVDYKGGAAVAELHVADGQAFRDDSLIFYTDNGSISIADAEGLYDGVSVPSAGNGRASTGELWDIHSFQISNAFGGIPGEVTLKMDGMESGSDCMGLVALALDLEPNSAPYPPGMARFEKEIVAGPDVDQDERIDVAIEVGQSEPSRYDFTISYTNTEGPMVLITDKVSADWNTSFAKDGETELNDGGLAVLTSANKKDDGKSPTRLSWQPDQSNPDSVVTVQAETRPFNKRKQDKFKPGSCGTLMLNEGASAYEVDPVTGKTKTDELGSELPPILVSNPLCLVAVKDLDGIPGIVRDGTGDEDGDGISDYAEACGPVTTDPCLADTDGDGLSDSDELSIGTDPVNPDSDGDGVADGADAAPLDPCNPDSEAQACISGIIEPALETVSEDKSLQSSKSPPKYKALPEVSNGKGRLH